MAAAACGSDPAGQGVAAEQSTRSPSTEADDVKPDSDPAEDEGSLNLEASNAAEIAAACPGPSQDSEASDREFAGPDSVAEPLRVSADAIAITTADALNQATVEQPVVLERLEGASRATYARDDHASVLADIAGDRKILLNSGDGFPTRFVAFESHDGSLVWLGRYCHQTPIWTSQYPLFQDWANNNEISIEDGIDGLVEYLTSYDVLQREEHGLDFERSLLTEPPTVDWEALPPKKRFITETGTPATVLDQLTFEWRLAVKVPEEWFSSEAANSNRHLLCVHLSVGLSECSSLTITPGQVPIATWLPLDGSDIELWIVDADTQLDHIVLLGTVPSATILETQEALTPNQVGLIDLGLLDTPLSDVIASGSASHSGATTISPAEPDESPR